MEDYYSIFTFQTLHNLKSRVSRLSKSCLIQYFNCDDVCSHALGPAGMQRKLSSLKFSLLRAGNGILSLVEERYVLLEMHVSFVKKE